MASGRKRGANDQLVPQQKRAVGGGDSVNTSAKGSSFTDDAVPTSFSTQSTQPNGGGFGRGNRLATITASGYKIIIPSQYCSLCAAVLKEGLITSCCGQAYCYRCKNKVCTMCPLCREPVPIRSTYPGAFGFGATCQFNQKERNSCLFLPYYEPEQLIPTRPPPINHPSYYEPEQLVPTRPPPINHPWILPFPQDSTIDHSHYQQPELFTSENSQDASFYCDQDRYGRRGRELQELECQICWNGRVECVFMPCGHARTCQSCSDRFVRQPCPFCRAIVYYILRMYL